MLGCPLLLLLPLLAPSVPALEEKDWGSFVIGSSCVLEAYMSQGGYTDAASNACGTCFEMFDDLAFVLDCASNYLPNIATKCAAQLATDDIGKFWSGALDCFYEYVKETDTTGEVQKGVMKFIEQSNGEKKSNEEWGTFVIVSSCRLETQIQGSDEVLFESCAKCFEDSNNLSVLRNCSSTFLPSMDGQCTKDMEANDVDLFWTGLLDCFYRYVKEKDVGGQVQNGVKAWMEMEKNGEWGSYVIRSSCVLETKNQQSAELCAYCFHKHDCLETTRNCSMHFLPNTSEHCATELSSNSTMDQFWTESIGCFHKQVMTSDADGKVQALVWNQMEMEKKNKEDVWGYLMGSSCLAESWTGAGFDQGWAKSCVTCFENADKQSQQNMEGISQCFEDFLPSMADCPGVMAGFGEAAGQRCLQAHLETLDVDGSARKAWVSMASTSDHQKEWEFTFGASCILESKNSDGRYDMAKAERCGECFAETTLDYIALQTKCTETFLPNMVDCPAKLAESEMSALSCYTKHLEELDVDSEARQTWMAMTSTSEHESKHQKEWEFTIGASCILESRRSAGRYDMAQVERCSECFAETTLDYMGLQTKCTATFLPNMLDCPAKLAESEMSALNCYTRHLEEMDKDGEARRMMELFMGSDESWTTWAMPLVMGVIDYIFSWFT